MDTNKKLIKMTIGSHELTSGNSLLVLSNMINENMNKGATHYRSYALSDGEISIEFYKEEFETEEQYKARLKEWRRMSNFNLEHYQKVVKKLEEDMAAYDAMLVQRKEDIQ